MNKIVMLAGVMALASCDNSPEARAAQNCKDDGMAFIMSRKFVERSLKSPSTAEFPSRATGSKKTAECKFIVQGYVDAQNSFGAMIRSQYQIEMEYLPDENVWRGLKLQM